MWKMVKKGEIKMAETILLVDDEIKVLDFMSSFLKNEGFEIATAQSGSEALSKIKEVNPALVVLDWMMPHINGLDVCREIRKTCLSSIELEKENSVFRFRLKRKMNMEK
jgi:CheY-like chemotaxis protein